MSPIVFVNEVRKDLRAKGFSVKEAPILTDKYGKGLLKNIVECYDARMSIENTSIYIQAILKNKES